MKATHKILLAILALTIIIGIASAFALTSSAGTPEPMQWYKQSVYVTNDTSSNDSYWANEGIGLTSPATAYRARSTAGMQKDGTESTIEFLISATSAVQLKIDYGYIKYEGDIFSITFENVVGTQATAADNVSIDAAATTLATGSKELTIAQGNVIKATIKYTKNAELSPSDELVYFNFYVNGNVINGNDIPATYLPLGANQTNETLDLTDKRLAKGDKVVRFDNGVIVSTTGRTLGAIVRYYAAGAVASSTAVYAKEYESGDNYLSVADWNTANNSATSPLETLGWTTTFGGDDCLNANEYYILDAASKTIIWNPEKTVITPGSEITEPIVVDTDFYQIRVLKKITAMNYTTEFETQFDFTGDNSKTYNGNIQTFLDKGMTENEVDFSFDNIMLQLWKVNATGGLDNIFIASEKGEKVEAYTNYDPVSPLSGEVYWFKFKSTNVAQSGTYYYVFQMKGTVTGEGDKVYASVPQIIKIDVEIKPATISVSLKNTERTYGWDGIFSTSNLQYGTLDSIIVAECKNVYSPNLQARIGNIVFGTQYFVPTYTYDITKSAQRQVGTYWHAVDATETELAKFNDDNGNFVLKLLNSPTGDTKYIKIIKKEITVNAAASISVSPVSYTRQYDGTVAIPSTAYAAWVPSVSNPTTNIEGLVKWGDTFDTIAFNVASAEFASKNANTTNAGVNYYLGTSDPNYKITDTTQRTFTMGSGNGITQRELDINWTYLYNSKTYDVAADKGTSSINRFETDYKGYYITFMPHIYTADSALATLVQNENIQIQTVDILSEINVGEYSATPILYTNNSQSLISNYKIVDAKAMFYCKITKATITINLKQALFEVEFTPQFLGDIGRYLNELDYYKFEITATNGINYANYSKTFAATDGITGVVGYDKLTKLALKFEKDPTPLTEPSDTLYPILIDSFETKNGSIVTNDNYNIVLADVNGEAPNVKIVKAKVIISIKDLTKQYGFDNSNIYGKSIALTSDMYTKIGVGTVGEGWSIIMTAPASDAYDSTSSSKRSAGAYTINVALDTSNSNHWVSNNYTYELAETSITLNIVPMPLSIKITATVTYGSSNISYRIDSYDKTLPYGENNSGLTLVSNAFIITDNSGTAYVVGDFYDNGKVTTKAGVTDILTNNNYTGTLDTVNSIFTVSPRPITITPNAITVEYGCTVDELRANYFNKASSYSATYTGTNLSALVEGDSFDYDKLALRYSPSAHTLSGTYITNTSSYEWKFDSTTSLVDFIKVDGATLTNERYAISFNEGSKTVTVTERVIYLTPDITTAYDINREFNGEARYFASDYSPWTLRTYAQYSNEERYSLSTKNTVVTKELLAFAQPRVFIEGYFLDKDGNQTPNVADVDGIVFNSMTHAENTGKFTFMFDVGVNAATTTFTVENSDSTHKVAITPKPVTCVANDKITKVYDDTKTVLTNSVTFKESSTDTEYTIEIAGLLEADIGKVKFTYNIFSSEYETSNATDVCDVTFKAVALTSTDNSAHKNYAWDSSYSLASDGAIIATTLSDAGKITKRDITVSLTAAAVAEFGNIIYGEAAVAVTSTDTYENILNLVPGHKETVGIDIVGYTPGNSVGSAVKLVPTIEIKNGSNIVVNGNYNITLTQTEDITTIIVPRVITVKLSADFDLTKVYGTADSAANIGINVAAADFYSLDNLYTNTDTTKNFTKLNYLKLGRMNKKTKVVDEEGITKTGEREYILYVQAYTLPDAAKGVGSNYNYKISYSTETTPITTGMFNEYTFTITPKTITIDTELVFNNKVYDASNEAVCDIVASNNNLLAANKFVTWDTVADDVSVANIVATFPSDNAANQANITINSVTLSGDDAENYEVVLNQTASKASIYKRPVYVTGLAAVNRPYDANSTAVGINTAGVVFTMLNLDGTRLSADNGVYAVDASEFKITATGSIASPNVIWSDIYAGTEASRDATMNLSLSNNNYIIFDATTVINSVVHDADALETVYTTPVTITAYRLDVAFTANDKTYDYTTDATVKSYIYSLPFSGQSIKVTGTTPTFDDADAGNRTVTISEYVFSASTVEGHASDYLNYVPNPTSEKTATAKINPRNVTVSNLKLDDFYYSGSKNVNASLFNLSGMLFTMDPTFTATPNDLGIFGDDKLSVKVTGEILLDNPNVQYDPENPTEIISQLINITIELIGVEGDAVSYNNYNLKNFTYPIFAKVIPLPITVTPTAGQSMFYGDPYYGNVGDGTGKSLTFDYQLTGYAANTPLSYAGSGATITETPSFTGALGLDYEDTDYSYEGSTRLNAGNYDIINKDLAIKTEGSFNAKNYSLSFATGEQFTIAPRQIVIKPDANQTAVYGESFDIEFTAENTLEGEVPEYTGALETTRLYVAVDDNPILRGDLAFANGTDGHFFASNYELVFSTTPVNFEITKRSIVVSYSTEVVYNGEVDWHFNNTTEKPIQATVPEGATYDTAMAYFDQISSITLKLPARYAGTYSTTATDETKITTISAEITSSRLRLSTLSDNYDITYVVTVTVTPKELKVPSGSLRYSIAYDGKNTTDVGISYEVGYILGLVDIDNNSTYSLEFLFTLSGKNAGDYPDADAGNTIEDIDIVSDSTAADIDKVIGSYTINHDRIVVTIQKKAIFIKISGEKTYDATPYVTTAADFTLSDISGNDLVAGDVIVGNSYKTNNADAGIYLSDIDSGWRIVRNTDDEGDIPTIIDGNGDDMTGNYNISLDAESKITINQRPITVKFNKTATYTAKVQTVDYTETEFYSVNGDGLVSGHEFFEGMCTTNGSDVGIYTFDINVGAWKFNTTNAFKIKDGTDVDVTINYEITVDSESWFEITKAILTIKDLTISADRYYTGLTDLNAATVGFAVDGYLGTDTVEAKTLITLSDTAWSSKDAGTKAIDFKATVNAPYDDNYCLEIVEGVYKTTRAYDDVALKDGEDGILKAEVYINSVYNIFSKSYDATNCVEKVDVDSDYSSALIVKNGAIPAGEVLEAKINDIKWASNNAGTDVVLVKAELTKPETDTVTLLSNYKLITRDSLTDPDDTDEYYPAKPYKDSDDFASIQKAPILVVPEAGQTKVYLASDPAEFGYDYYCGDIQTDLTTDYVLAANTNFDGATGIFAGKLARADGEDVGAYAYTLGTLALQDSGEFDADNYYIETLPTPDDNTERFVITPRTLTATPAYTTKEFGSADPTMKFNFQIDTTGLATAMPVPGTNEIIVINGDTYVKATYLTPYDKETCNMFTGALTRHLAGSTATATAVPEGEKVGFYNILKGNLALADVNSIGFKAANYKLEVVETAETAETESYTLEVGEGKNEFEITKAELYLKAASYTVVYGDAAPIYTFTLEGLKFEEAPETVYDATGLLAESPVYGANSPVKAGGYAINFYKNDVLLSGSTDDDIVVLIDTLNYEWADDKYVEGTVTVIKKLIMLIIEDDEITYGDLRPAVTVIGDKDNYFDYDSAAYTAVTFKTDRNYDFVNGESFESLFGYSNFTSTSDYGVGSVVGDYSVNAVTPLAHINAWLLNYTVIDYSTTDTENDIQPGKLTVNKYVIYIAPNADSVKKTYGEDDPAATEWGWTLGEGQVLPRGEVISYDGSSLTFTRAAGENAGSYAYNFSVVLTRNELGSNIFRPGNYEVQIAKDADDNDLTFVIEKKAITVTGVVANEKIYDASTDVTFNVSGMSIVGLVKNSNIAIDDTVAGKVIVTPAGNFIDKNAGSVKGVEFTYTITGTSADNYVIKADSQFIATAEISPKEVTISGILANNKNYDRTTAATLDISEAVITGFIAGDDLGFKATGVFNSKNVWEADTVTITYVGLTGTDKDNYALNAADSQKTATASIAKIGLTVSGIAAANKVYDKKNTVEFLYGEATFVGLLGEEGDKDKVQVVATGVFPSVNVGSYRIEITIALVQNEENGKDSGNYFIQAGSQEAVNAQILKVDLHITINNLNAVYGTLNSALTFTYVCNESDFVDEADKNSAVLGIVLSTNYNSGDKNNRNVGKYTISGTSNVLDNYKVVFTNGELVIDRKPINITADDFTVTYGDDVPAYSVTPDELASWDEVALDEGERVFDGTLILDCNYTKGSDVGNYPIRIKTSTLSNANYSITFVDGNVEVIPAILTATVGDANVVYGEALPENWTTALTTVEITGFVLDQTEATIVDRTGLTFNTAYAVGNAAGSTTDITATGIDLLSDNYSLEYVKGTLTVGKRSIKIQANDYSALEYGEAVATDGYGFIVTEDSTYGIYGEDVLGVTYTYGEYAPGKDIGEYPIVPAATNANYSFEYVNGTLTVIPRVVVITINDKTIVYGNDAENDGYTAVKSIFDADDLAALALEYKYYVAAETLETEYAAGNNVGDYVITIAYTENANYAITIKNGKLTVAQREITVTPDDITVTYGDALPEIKTYQVTDGAIFGTDSIGTPAYSFKNAADEDYAAGSNAGAYTISITGLENSNYIITLATGTLTVNKKALTVTVTNPAAIIYGDEKPESFTYSYEGIYEAKDTEATIFGEGFAPTLTCAYVKGDDVGEYAIEISGYPTEITNYVLTIVNGKLVVTVKPITVTAKPATITYGDAPANDGYTIEGILDGDALEGTATYEYTYTRGDDVGEYVISVAGLSNSNYRVAFVDGVLTVNKASLTLSAVDKTIVYGNDLPDFAHTITGFVLGQDEETIFADQTVSFECDYARGDNAGEYVITPSYGEFVPTNYSIVIPTTSAKLTVDKKPLSFYIENATVVYGEVAAYNIVWDGFIVDGENGIINDTFANALEGSFTFYAPDYRTSANVGKYKIVVYMEDGYLDNQTNYKLTEDKSRYTDSDAEYTLTCASLTVTQRPLTIKANDIALTYGSAIPEYTYAIADEDGIDGLNVNDILSDVITIRLTSSYAKDANASATAYPIVVTETAQGVKYDNYIITLVDAGVTVTARDLIITPVLTTKLMGTSDPTIKYIVGATFNNQVPVIRGALSREAAGETDVVGSYDVLIGTLKLESAPGFISTNYVIKLADFEGKFVITNVLINTLKASVSLKDIININYGYGIITYGDVTFKAGGVLEWTAEQYAALTSYDYEANTAYNRTLYRATSVPGCNYMSVGSGIASRSYSETYYTRPYVVVAGEEGDVYIYGDVFEYSVQTYAAKVFAQENVAFDSLKTAIIAMLDYGSKAQVYFNYDNDNLANAIVTPELRSAYGNTYSTALDAQQTTPEWTLRVDGILNTGLNWQGIRLSLGEEFRIDFGGAMGVDGLTVDNFRMIYWTQEQYEAAKAAGTPLNPEDATALVAQRSGNTAVARISGIGAKDASDKYYVAMEYTNEFGETSYSYVYEGSISIYATKSIYSSSASATAEFKALAKALLVYTDAAKACFGD